MTIFLLKSLLSLLVLVLAAYSMLTMLKIFGREEEAVHAPRLKRRHKAAGYLFLSLVLFISYICIRFASASRVESPPRAAIHEMLALAILALFAVKVLFVRAYRRFYGQARTIGIAIAVLSFTMVGISGGHYLAVSRFGQDRTMDRSTGYAFRGPFLAVEHIGHAGVAGVRTDKRSIELGRELFASHCSRCHDPNSTRTIVGPGLQGLLKRPTLPASGNRATAESIRFQLKQPLGRMPSFANLTEEEIEDLIAYLNTL